MIHLLLHVHSIIIKHTYTYSIIRAANLQQITFFALYKNNLRQIMLTNT